MVKIMTSTEFIKKDYLLIKKLSKKMGVSFSFFVREATKLAAQDEFLRSLVERAYVRSQKPVAKKTKTKRKSRNGVS